MKLAHEGDPVHRRFLGCRRQNDDLRRTDRDVVRKLHQTIRRNVRQEVHRGRHEQILASPLRSGAMAKAETSGVWHPAAPAPGVAEVGGHDPSPNMRFSSAGGPHAWRACSRHSRSRSRAAASKAVRILRDKRTRPRQERGSRDVDDARVTVRLAFPSEHNDAGLLEDAGVVADDAGAEARVASEKLLTRVRLHLALPSRAKRLQDCPLAAR